MKKAQTDWNAIEKLLAEMIDMQQKRVFTCGRQIVPNLTADDMLQPNDFLELENHPVFRYEEGMLAGLQSAHIALRALQNEEL